MNVEFENAIKKILTEEQIERQESLAKHTTFRIGGPADYFLKPKNEDEIANIIACCKEQNIPYYVLGNGSNVLAEDEGYSGVILHVGKNFSSMEIKKNTDGILRRAVTNSTILRYTSSRLHSPRRSAA